MRRSGKPFDCPVCGDEVPAKARSCPGCGACDKSGWSEQSRYDSLDLPDEAYGDEKIVTADFGGRPKTSLSQWLWRLVALGLLLWMIWASLPH